MSLRRSVPRPFGSRLPVALLLAVALSPAALRAQDDAASARYAAAIAWFDLVAVEHDFVAAAAQAHESVAAQLTPAMLENAWGQLSGQLGALSSVEPKQQAIQQGMHIVVLTGVFANGAFDVQVVMDEEHAVAGFFVRPPGGI